MNARRKRSRPMLVLGLMSGTSADGIDVAFAEISGAPPRVKSKLRAHTALKFPSAVRDEILRVAEQQPITAGELSQLNVRLGEVFADAVISACRKFRVSPKQIDLIGSHGQTIFHQGRPVKYLGTRDGFYTTNRRGQHYRRANRNHHRRRLSPRRHRRRRTRRSAGSLRRLSVVSPRKTGPRLAKSGRHREHHSDSRQREAVASFCVRYRPGEYVDRRAGRAFQQRSPTLRQKCGTCQCRAAAYPHYSMN